MPFKPSTTLDNVLATGHAVLNLVTDTRVFAGCVTGRRELADRARRAKSPACAWRVRSGHVELALQQHRRSATPGAAHGARARGQPRAVHGPQPRAGARWSKGAVLVSRLHMLPPHKVDAEMAYLQIAIDKTAGARRARGLGLAARGDRGAPRQGGYA